MRKRSAKRNYDASRAKLNAPAPSAPSVARDASQTHDGLQNLVAGLGTNRDKMSYSGYTAPMLLDRQTLENMYASSWLAAKIVDIPADDMTRAWRTFLFDDEGVAKENQFAIELEESRLSVCAKVNEALKWARLFGGSVIVMDTGADWTKPLEVNAIKKGGLRQLTVFDRWTCDASGSIDWDVRSPNFGLPAFYRVGYGNNITLIHHSHIIRLIGHKQPYYAAQLRNHWGDSLLQKAYDTLLSKDTITANIATMTFEANVDVITVDGLTDLVSTQDGETKVLKRFQLASLMKSINRTLLMDSNEKHEKKSNTFSGLDSLLREFRAEIAGAADIPVTRMFGTSVGGLNATGDNEIRNYYDMVASQQNMMLREALNKLDAVLVRSALGEIPSDYRFNFKPLWQMDETEKATVEKTRAERDNIYLQMGVITEGLIAQQLKEDATYNGMTEEDIELAKGLNSRLGEEGSSELLKAAQQIMGSVGSASTPKPESQTPTSTQLPEVQ
jgi:uncharacterized protein